jgi:hypothetical protein
MQRIAALIGCPAVQELRLTAVASALGLSNLCLKPAVAARLQALIVTADRRLRASQVDSCGTLRRRSFPPLNEYGHTQPPLSHRILGETALAPPGLF